MKKHTTAFKSAIVLRKQGHSLKEISDALGISRSTAGLWVQDIVLSVSAKRRILEKQSFGRKAGAEKSQRRREERDVRIDTLVKTLLPTLRFTQEQCKSLCALLYGCEGSKNESGRVVFVNSDPELIRFFLFLFRSSFVLDENRFRALIHLHGYHDQQKQLRFWSDVTGIPKSQFTRSYQKQNGGKNIRVGYQGCLSIRYGDVSIQKELIALYREMIKLENYSVILS